VLQVLGFAGSRTELDCYTQWGNLHFFSCCDDFGEAQGGWAGEVTWTPTNAKTLYSCSQ